MKRIIYILSKAFFYALTVFFCFVFVFSILAFAEHNLNWDAPFVEITQQNEHTLATITPPFLGGMIEFPLNFLIIGVMWIGILFYAIYFYALKEFFKVFIEDTAFNSKSLKRLKVFFYINLIPLGYAVILSVIQIIRTGQFKFEEDQGIAIVHLFVALLIYFYMDLLKKGKQLQEENDLTI